MEESMTKRMAVMLVAMAALVFGLGVTKALQIKAAIAQASSFQPPPETVTTIVAAKVPWSESIRAIGTVAAVHGVTVSADLPGLVDSISFDSGRAVRQGEVLVQLDARQERAQLAAAEAQRDLARTNLKRAQDLVAQGIVAKADYDRVIAEDKQAQARVGEIQATIERKQIRAPFSGILGIRQVNLGQYLAGGDPIVPLQSLDPIYVNFSVPQQQVAALALGAAVRVAGQSLPETMSGRITAINSVVDPSTRNVEIQATLANAHGRLRPGMFVEAEVVLGEAQLQLALPASAISYAPYGDSVFVVAELQDKDGARYRGVKQQFVKLADARGDQVAVVSGIEPGAEVVTSGAFKLRSGAAVRVDNGVRPSNDPAPKPEDN
jgi:membrane fusion protein (multidrug efflux system)